MKETTYEDFGHVIYGAKKFNYLLNSENLEEVNLNLLIKETSKKKLWPTPVIEGRDRFVNFILSKFYSCIRSKLRTDSRDEIADFINQICTLKEINEQIETEKEAIDLIKTVQRSGEHGEVRFNPKLLFYKRLKMWELTRSQMDYEGFGLTKREKVTIQVDKRLKKVKQNHDFKLDRVGKTLYIIGRDGRDKVRFENNLNIHSFDKNRYLIILDRKLEAINKTEEEFEEFKNNLIEAELKGKHSPRTKYKRIQYEHLKSVKRTGPDYRNGRDITPEELREQFNLYGGQFGNYISQTERVEVINYAYDSFTDLALALGLKSEDISLGGSLSIAFGARGSGTKAAQYEPSYRVINLSRLKGAGNLAHEFFHALDHYLSILFGNEIDLFSLQNQTMVKSLRELVQYLLDEDCKFSKDAIKLDTFEGRRKMYWSSIPEMLARAFTSYLIDNLKLRGIVNTYLCYEFGIYLEDGEELISAYPQGEDRVEINKLFDKLFTELKKLGVFNYSYNRQD